MVYLDMAYKEKKRLGQMSSLKELYETVSEAASNRLRPLLMTVMASILGLMPVMWSSGAGADVMKRIAAPLIGGLISSTVLTLVVLPAVYVVWKGDFGFKKVTSKEKA